MTTKHLKVKVSTNAKVSQINDPMADGTLKIQVKAQREKGKANSEVITLLSEHYNLPKSSFEIISGHTASLKMIKIQS